MNALERFLEQLNSNVFLREFTFSRTTFSPQPGREFEFADQVVPVDDVWMLFQFKQRSSRRDSPKALDSWFERKVVREATRQVRDTLKYLSEHNTIVVRNRRGHEFNLASQPRTTTYKIVVYDPGESAPRPIMLRPFHRSRTAGFIHLIDVESYLNICQILITPAEIWEYLDFREEVLSRHAYPGEVPLFGQFLEGALDEEPDPEFGSAVARLVRNEGEFDVRFITQNFLDRIQATYEASSATDYYRFLAEFAKLDRSELKEFKTRFRLCIEAVEQDEFRVPYRIQSTRTECGFVLIPATADMADRRLTALKNFAIAAKYDQRLDRQIGVTISHSEPYFNIEWVFLEYPWAHDPDLERMLRDNYPFRELRGERIPRYFLSE